MIEHGCETECDGRCDEHEFDWAVEVLAERTRAERAESVLARVEAILRDPPAPSRMLIPVIMAALYPETGAA